MFKNNEKILVEGLSIISSDTVVTGNIETTSHLRVDGKIEGSLNSNTNVAISEVGFVLGDIQAHSLKVSGKVKGNVIIKEKLTLDQKGMIEGDAKAAILVVEEGGKISGKIEMGKQVTSSGEESKA